jgi:hypothetical protein
MLINSSIEYLKYPEHVLHAIKNNRVKLRNVIGRSGI